MYNSVQPYISFLPILAFVFIRNATESCRKTTSWFYRFFGKISLETFVAQFHIWLAMDTRGLLVVFPQSWLVNFIVTTFLFVYLSNVLSDVTNALTAVLGKNSKQLWKRTLIYTTIAIAFNHFPC